MISICVPLLAASLVSTSLSTTSSPFFDEVPRLVAGPAGAGYHGLVKENETLVEVTPPIRATGPSICAFRIVNKHHGEAPFQVVLKGEGEAELRARRALNCEKRKSYKFDIAAVSCAGVQSENVTVHITVVDINEYAPAFLEASYVCQVDEGRLYNEIVRVEASDRDCTPKFGDICKYEILTADQPFAIDNEGTIRNTEPLDYERSHNHILSVVAYDCGMKQSQPVMVTIKVNRICKLGWKGIAERVDYAPGSGAEELFPAAQLKLCDVPCQVKEVSARVSLATKHIDKGCDRDTYSVQNQRRLCGASTESIELLSGGRAGTTAAGTVATDDGRESDEIYEFDGSGSAITVEPGVLKGLAPTFTMSTWLKHRHHPDLDKHAKEHILCSADDHKMNRHHYAWFVRNCRLILLLRRDFSDGDLNIFRPAEWRWKLPQVCDDEWHHYAVSVKFPEVELYVDGRLFRAEKKNPEIIDDWPLHPTKDINTTLVVGACWQGSEKKMKHHLRGYLAALTVLVGKQEKPSVLACLHKCKESLEVPSTEVLQPGMQLLTSSDLTELSIEGDNKTNLEALIRKIGYSNSRQFPTPGRRNLHLSTVVTCEHGKTVKVPNIESYVMVLPPQEPRLSVNGTANIASDYHDFRGDENSGGNTVENERRLDSCIVTVYPALNPDHEALAVPHAMLTRLGVQAKLSKDGATLSGSSLVKDYQQVLRQIEYTNRKPAYYLNRVFKLICSEMNGRFLSNEYVQTLTVIHPRTSNNGVGSGGSSSVGNAASAERGVLEHNGPVAHALTAHISDHGGTGAPATHAVTVVTVVCVAFLVVMVALGLVRVRAAAARAAHDDAQDAEMAWDDSALTITVNPMEGAEECCGTSGGSGGARRRGGGGARAADDDSSDAESTYRDDDDDDLDSSDDDADDNLAAVGKLKDLEWDNSTM